MHPVDEPTGGEGETAPAARDFYERSAGGYDRWVRHYERWMGLGEARRRLVAQARGNVLEIGVGTGANLGLYAPDVRLSGVDLSPAMLRGAEARARALRMSVELRVADAGRLPFSADSFDTVVATLVLSSIPDPRRALTEMRRALRPGGKLLVLEHVLSPIRPVRWLQRAVAPVPARLAGWYPARELDDDVLAAGFVIDAAHRSRWGMLEELIAHIPG